MSRVSYGVITATFATLVASCASSAPSRNPDSGANSGAGCAPPPESCDLGSAQLRPIEAQGCLGALTTLTQVCVTSVNRCSASTGLGIVCAFGPDGGAYVTIGSDNDVLTAAGWHFAQYVEPATVPADQIATAAEATVCAQLACATPCPGVTASSFPFGRECHAYADDAGIADGITAGE